MSGAAFEGLEGLALGCDTASYDRSSLYNPALIESYLEHFLEEKEAWRVGNFDNDGSDFHRLTEWLHPLVENDNPADASAFLEALLASYDTDAGGHAGRRLKGPSLVFYGMILSPAVQALFLAGHNDFVLDFSKVRGVPYSTVQHLWSDNKCQPLRMRLIGDVNSAGDRLRNCSVELFGDTYSAGNESFMTTFTLHGKVTTPFKIGRKGGGNSFYTSSDRVVYTGGDIWNTRYYLLEEPAPERIAYIKRLKRFVPRGNKLLVKDGTGWREVVP